MKLKASIFMLFFLFSLEYAEAAIRKLPVPETGVSVLKIDVRCEPSDVLCDDFAKRAKVLWRQDGTQALTEAQFRGDGASILKLQGVDFESLAINNGVRLGMSDTEVTALMGRPLGEVNENGLSVRTYKDFRRAPCESAALGRYAFKNGKLQSYEIECEIP